MFISEILRSRRTSIRRAAEISDWVFRHLDEITSEERALKTLSDIEKDFEEVMVLTQALHFGRDVKDVEVYEKEIKNYAAELFAKDMAKSAAFLREAARPETDMRQLCIKYPDFCFYVRKIPEKSGILGDFVLSA